MANGFGLRPCLAFFLFICFAAAFPWPGSFENIDALVLRRAESSTSGSSTAKSAAASSAAASGGSAATTGTVKSGNGTTTTHHTTKTTAIDPRLPPGGIEMVTPNPIAAATYYKVGDYVTFAWNYTSLSVTPTAIDILASCSLNSQLYTISMNQSVGATGAVTWDTGEYQATATVPLLVASYTLVIYDADKGLTSTPSAGYLDTFDQFAFGMYTPQPYTPLNEFKCATCSAALSAHERQALSLVFIMGTITVLSFTWFASGFGVF